MNAMKPPEIALLYNFRWQKCKERPNRSTNNGDMAETANRYVVCEWGSDTLVRSTEAKQSTWP